MTSLEIFFENPISQIWTKDEIRKTSLKNPDEIIQYVCDFFCQDKENVLSKKRYVEFCIVRQFCMYMVRKKTHLTYESIGEYFNRDHTSIMSAVKKIESYVIYDNELYNYLTLLKEGVNEKNPITDWWSKKRFSKKRSLNYTFMESPIRVQRSRITGYRHPENTMYVGRPTQWGNPFKLGYNAIRKELWQSNELETIKEVLDSYESWLELKIKENTNFLEPLRGKNLSCYCNLSQPCHVDIILKKLYP